MSQNKLITILAVVLLLVIAGSVAILVTSSPDATPGTSTTTAPTGKQYTFNLDVLQQQAYQLINKQLVREGALPVAPPATPGKANPFL